MFTVSLQYLLLIVFSTRAAGGAAGHSRAALCSLCLQVQDFSFQHRKVAVVAATVSSVSVCQRCYWLDGESAVCVPDGRWARPRRRWCSNVIIVVLILQSILIIFLFFKGASVQAFVLKHKTKNLKTHPPGPVKAGWRGSQPWNLLRLFCRNVEKVIPVNIWGVSETTRYSLYSEDAIL